MGVLGLISTLTLDLPPTLNDQLNTAKGGARGSSALKRKWTRKVASEAKKQGIPSYEKLWVEIGWYVKNFGRDGDNLDAAQKFIFDGLVYAGVIPRDNLTVVQSPKLIHYLRSETGGDYAVIKLYSFNYYKRRLKRAKFRT